MRITTRFPRFRSSGYSHLKPHLSGHSNSCVATTGSPACIPNYGHWGSTPRPGYESHAQYARAGSRRRHLSSSRKASLEERSDFLNDFIQAQKPSQDTLKYFSSLDWTREIFGNDAYQIVPFYSRHCVEETGENRFFARIVNTYTTVPHILAFQVKNLKTPESTTSRLNDQASPPLLDLTDSATPEVICLMALGDDLQAHPSIVHGGFQAIIFDEVMRLLILLHQNNICVPGPRDIHFTATMTISYSAAVAAPSNILVRSRLLRREGRKWFARAEIVSSAGKILTTAESMWVTAKPVVRS
jgi:acyl-coenzyme A thioesterase PaaI-like protein